jgi:hypothetical protein
MANTRQRKATKGEKCIFCSRKFRKGERIIEDDDVGIYCADLCKTS